MNNIKKFESFFDFFKNRKKRGTVLSNDDFEKVCVKLTCDDDVKKLREILPKYNQEIWRLKSEFDFMGKKHKVESPGLTISFDKTTADWYLQYRPNSSRWSCYPYKFSDQVPISIEQLETLLKDGEINI
jgi:hypothetical protein